ncbi:MAG: serine protease [Candidatus Acidiferrales bacterium]
MESTFEIQSVALPGQQPSLGATFIIGRPLVSQPNMSRYVLVTAAHVLEGMAGDIAILNLRKETKQGEWQKMPTPLQIRNNGRPLWVKHPNADVAVMYVGLPDGVVIPLMTTALLADDEMLKKFQVHPGDTLLCLGYPFGIESSQSGFPVLRSGRIASFPLTPTAQTKTFLFDFAVFEGNSGGPVYMVDRDREYENFIHMGQTVGLIAGLVSGETTRNEQLAGQYSAEIRRIPLNLATVVHASFIKEAINMLPPPDEFPQTSK